MTHQYNDPSLEATLNFCLPAIARGDFVIDDNGQKVPATESLVVDSAQNSFHPRLDDPNNYQLV